jgi:hypothetical protein
MSNGVADVLQIREARPDMDMAEVRPGGARGVEPPGLGLEEDARLAVDGAVGVCSRGVCSRSRPGASHDPGDGQGDQQERAPHAGFGAAALRGASSNSVRRRRAVRRRAKCAEWRGHPWPPGPPEVGGSLRPAPVLPSMSYPPPVQRAAGREVGSNRTQHRVLARCRHEGAAAPATNVYPPLDAGSSPSIPFGMFRVAVCV